MAIEYDFMGDETFVLREQSEGVWQCVVIQVSDMVALLARYHPEVLSGVRAH